MPLTPLRLLEYDVHEDSVYNLLVKYGDRYYISTQDMLVYGDQHPRQMSSFIESLLLLNRFPRRILIHHKSDYRYQVLTPIREYLAIKTYLNDGFALEGLAIPEVQYNYKPRVREGLLFSQLYPGEKDNIYFAKYNIVVLRPHMNDEEVEYVCQHW